MCQRVTCIFTSELVGLETFWSTFTIWKASVPVCSSLVTLTLAAVTLIFLVEVNLFITLLWTITQFAMHAQQLQIIVMERYLHKLRAAINSYYRRVHCLLVLSIEFLHILRSRFMWNKLQMSVLQIVHNQVTMLLFTAWRRDSQGSYHIWKLS